MGKNWKTVKLPEVAELNPRRLGNPPQDKDLVSFVPMRTVEEESGRMSAAETRPWGDVKKGYTPFQEGDVLFAKITPCMENGKYAIARDLHQGRAAGSTEFHVFRPSAQLDAQYLLNFLFSHGVRQAARMNMRGAAGQLRVPASFFEELEIPLAPLQEQQRIVAEIEKQFTRLEAGLAGLRRVQANLKRYRAAVLKSACEGKLVPNEVELAKAEDHKVETGAELLERILSERRKNWTGRGKYKEPEPLDTSDLPNLPAGWTWTKAEQLASLVTSGSRGWGDFYSDSGSLFIRAQDIKTDSLNLGGVARVSLPPNAEGIRSFAENDDLLVTITGANVTKSAIIRGLAEEAFVSQHVALIKPVLRQTAPFTLTWILSPAHGRRQLEQWAYGAGKPGLSLKQVRDLPIALPPLLEQTRIVAEVERRLSVIDEVESVVAANLQRSMGLRKSILQRAFSGDLVS